MAISGHTDQDLSSVEFSPSCFAFSLSLRINTVFVFLFLFSPNSSLLGGG